MGPYPYLCAIFTLSNSMSVPDFTLRKQKTKQTESCYVQKSYTHTANSHRSHCVSQSSLGGACHAFIRMKQAHPTAHPSNSNWSPSFCVAEKFHDAPSSLSTYKLRRLYWTTFMSLNPPDTVGGGMRTYLWKLQYVEYMNINDSQFIHERRGSTREPSRGAVCCELVQVRHYFVTTCLHLLGPHLFLSLPHTHIYSTISHFLT